MDEELLQAVRHIHEELKELKEKLAAVEATVNKTDSTIDKAINALKNKPSLAALLKILQRKNSGKENENEDE